MLHQPQGLAPPPPAPRTHLSNPALPQFAFTPTVLIKTADVPKPLARSPGRKRLPGKKRGLEVGVVLETSF